jgi:hypothetical protein
MHNAMASKVAHFVVFAGMADVAIDLAGTALGLGLAWAAVRLKLLRF